MSDRDRPDQTAFEELATVVRHLSEELANFRRRALTAESRLRELEGAGMGEGAEESTLRARIGELEGENATLRTRLDAALGRTTQMLDRVRFLRQQAQAGGERGGDR